MADDFEPDILDDWQYSVEVLIRDGLKCVYCGLDGTQSTAAFHQLMVHDHLLPKSRGGSLVDPDNLVTSCWPCNKRKGAFDPRDRLRDGKRNPNTPRERMIENVKAKCLAEDMEYWERARAALLARLPR